MSDYVILDIPKDRRYKAGDFGADAIPTDWQAYSICVWAMRMNGAGVNEFTTVVRDRKIPKDTLRVAVTLLQVMFIHDEAINREMRRLIAWLNSKA